MTDVRTSLEVGFPDEALPARFAALRGRAWRRVPASPRFPFEGSQFEVVIMHESALSRSAVKEAHRVLRTDGRLVFAVPARTRRRPGWTLPDVYSLVRDGFHIVELERPCWWKFWRRDGVLSICARKKAWKCVRCLYRPYA